MCDTKGIIYDGRQEGMNSIKEQIAKISNPDKLKGSLEDAIANSDVFVGVSVANLLTKSILIL